MGSFGAAWAGAAGGALLAAAVFLWLGRRWNGRVRELQAELERLRHENAQNLDLDRLTGLFNHAALARRMEQHAVFEGVAAVCDMDGFKEINDRHGHLAGDEILRNIGRLLHASVRGEDEAFRWGGDEFVILFRDQRPEVATRRMAGIEGRLRDFQLRGIGAVPISFSWGTAEARGRALRETLEDADRNMYAMKRQRGTAGPAQPPPA